MMTTLRVTMSSTLQDHLVVLRFKEDPDLWKWLTGQEQPPETVNSNPVFSAVRDKVMGNLNSHASPETRAAPGKPWVRVSWEAMGKRMG
ncbi:hypothetical protein IFM89_014631 [Coptis chinensis]|uniref:Uncharacterized protein n=1 Tax=Coptis chinensis TaxID=261450 RepID=A0A835HTU4_9MAGN|nr:hypothetical protein IFM89_014631 [Coptis chinensis]